MEKKFDIIELEIDWEGPGLSASRPIPKAPAVPTDASSEAEKTAIDPGAAPAETAQPARAPARVLGEPEVAASAPASVVPDDVKPEVESGAASVSGEAEVAELEELEELEELDDSFLEPVDEAAGSAVDQDDPGTQA